MRWAEAIGEARRVMQVCNACRYCEGYCAVFPAMELRRAFSDGDLDYLANLCHGCRGCYYACQYAPPHEFAIAVPRALAALRAESYARSAWPPALAGLYERNAAAVAWITASAVTIVLLAAIALQQPAVLFGVNSGAGAFYAVIPFPLMAGLAGAVFAFALTAIGIGAVRFWLAAGPGAPPALAALPRAGLDMLTLRYLGGGGYGCNDASERFSQARRWLHHALFYGFALCFASTSVAAFYEHVLHRSAPYPLLSLPVVLGTLGGIGMLAGSAGLLWLKVTGDAAPADPRMSGADTALLLLLGMTALSGLLLLALRETRAMGTLLALHLGFVMALFIAMPYSKFVHGVYRGAALLRHAMEQRAARAGGSAHA